MLDSPPGFAPQDADDLAARLTATALRALEERRPQEALPALDRLRRLPMQAAAAEALRAEALLALGRADEAEVAASLALAASPGDPARLELRARALVACDRTEDALDAAAAAVLAEPRSVTALLLLGTLLLDASRHDEALVLLAEAVRQRPEDLGLALRLGVGFVKAGRHAAAEELLDHLAALRPRLRGLAAARAQAALARGEREVAIRLARHGLEEGGPEPMLYSVLAHACQSLGRAEEAMVAFRAASRLAPEDPYLAHLAATAEGVTTGRATPGYVSSLFDGYAAGFEASLISLGYRVPGLVRRAVERHRPDVAAGRQRLGPVLDLGCGTGLVGVALYDLLGGPLVGIDLSANMLEHAAAKQIYSMLRRDDLLTALPAETSRFELVAAADVFCYLGDLSEVLRLCRHVMAPGALLVFSVERAAEGEGYRLHAGGRYAHAPDLVRADLLAAGLRPVELSEEPLRLENGRPVPGLLVVAEAAAER